MYLKKASLVVAFPAMELESSVCFFQRKSFEDNTGYRYRTCILHFFPRVTFFDISNFKNERKHESKMIDDDPITETKIEVPFSLLLHVNTSTANPSCIHAALLLCKIYLSSY